MANADFKDHRADTGHLARYGYEDNQDNKPTKAVIGVAILIALSLVLYQLSPTSGTSNSAATTMTRDVASAPARAPAQ